VKTIAIGLALFASSAWAVDPADLGKCAAVEELLGGEFSYTGDDSLEATSRFSFGYGWMHGFVAALRVEERHVDKQIVQKSTDKLLLIQWEVCQRGREME
jgi:hypothetical protein